MLVSPDGRRLLDQLRRDMEAESDNEVIRRALRLLDRIEPTDLRQSRATASPVETERGLTVRLHVVLPDPAVKRLLRLHEEWKSEGLPCSFGEIVRQAIRVAVQVYRTAERDQGVALSMSGEQVAAVLLV